MKKMILNIMATTGIALIMLALIAIYYGGTVIFISAVFEVLGLNIVIYAGIYFMDYFEYRYPILETGLKLIYILALVLISGLIFDWYKNMSGASLVFMTVAVFVVGLFLDTWSMLDEVKSINALIQEDKK